MQYILYFGGLFNRNILGLAIYHYLIVLMLIGIVGICAGFYFLFWYRLTPYHGVFWAHLRKTGISEVFDENMHFDLITDRSAKVIFNETFKQAQEAEDDKTNVRAATIGKVACDFIFDPDKWTYPGSSQHVIIEDVAERYNAGHPEDQVRTLIKFYRYWALGKFDEDAESVELLKGLKKYYEVPWSRILMMYATRTEDQWFGFMASLSERIKEVETQSLNGYWWLPVVASVFLCAGILVKHFLK